MATASGSNEEDIFDSVQPKNPIAKDNNTDETKSAAFIPAELSKDLLRIELNEQQLADDAALARRLQYGDDSASGVQAAAIGSTGGYFSHDLTPDRARALATSLGRGRLQIDIVEARLAKNYGFTKMDPYVRVKIGTKVYESPTSYGAGKTPKWAKTLMCYLPHNVDTISIEIFDEKSFTNDELVAFVKFPLPATLFHGQFINEWIPLSGKLGEQKEGHINIQMLYTPIENLQQQETFLYQNVQAPITSSLPSAKTSAAIQQPRVVQLPPDSTMSGEVTQADLYSISEMFPTFEIDVIKSVLESNHGRREPTIEALLQMGEDNDNQSSST